MDSDSVMLMYLLTKDPLELVVVRLLGVAVTLFFNFGVIEFILEVTDVRLLVGVERMLGLNTGVNSSCVASSKGVINFVGLGVRGFNDPLDDLDLNEVLDLCEASDLGMDVELSLDVIGVSSSVIFELLVMLVVKRLMNLVRFESLNSHIFDLMVLRICPSFSVR
ncbi:hypothetical protein WICPIJ_010031 [Wickerhamomyces pijperi]|uniref:Uncharacterized protein n=1 Tax=Wickerhamomyces pijperi TaxID=599730 RepID=A0A9P8TB68_WICPI|nr:hypothetical protein WICPIJ_010031 [Wickerhamomyces pijperi]